MHEVDITAVLRSCKLPGLTLIGAPESYLQARPPGALRIEPAPLPLRTDPYPYESWLGYTHRVAARLGVRWTELLTPVLCCETACRAVRQSMTDIGVYASPETAQLLADYFRLEPAEIEAMQLAAILRAFYWSWQPLGTYFDPILTRRHQVRCGHFHMPRGFGSDAVLRLSSQRHCHLCQAEQPGYWSLLWRFAWYPACLRHGILLTETTDDEEPKVKEAPTPLLDCLDGLLGYLDGDPEHALGVMETLWDWVEALRPRDSGLYARKLPIAVMADVLPRAWHATTNGLDYRDLPAWTSPYGYASAVQQMLATTPDALRHVASQMNDVPAVLPMNLYAPEISDLIYPQDIADGQAIIAELIAHAGGARTWGSEWNQQQRAGRAAQLIAIWASLEDQGRADDLWAAITHAARRLVAAAQSGARLGMVRGGARLEATRA